MLTAGPPTHSCDHRDGKCSATPVLLEEGDGMPSAEYPPLQGGGVSDRNDSGCLSSPVWNPNRLLYGTN